MKKILSMVMIAILAIVGFGSGASANYPTEASSTITVTDPADGSTNRMGLTVTQSASNIYATINPVEQYDGMRVEVKLYRNSGGTWYHQASKYRYYIKGGDYAPVTLGFSDIVSIWNGYNYKVKTEFKKYDHVTETVGATMTGFHDLNIYKY